MYKCCCLCVTVVCSDNGSCWRRQHVDDSETRQWHSDSALGHVHLHDRRYTDQRARHGWSTGQRTDASRIVSTVDAFVDQQLLVGSGDLWQRCTGVQCAADRPACSTKSRWTFRTRGTLRLRGVVRLPASSGRTDGHCLVDGVVFRRTFHWCPVPAARRRSVHRPTCQVSSRHTNGPTNAISTLRLTITSRWMAWFILPPRRTMVYCPGTSNIVEQPLFSRALVPALRILNTQLARTYF